MSVFRFAHNSKRILSFASSAISRFENEISSEGNYTISCEKDVIERVNMYIEEFKPHLSKYEYSDQELEETAMNYVSNCSFELLEGNKYRVMGRINLVGPARNAVSVHRKALKWALDHDLITEEEAEEDELALQDVIRMRL